MLPCPIVRCLFTIFCQLIRDDSLIEVIHKINMKTLTSIFKLVLAVAKTDVVHQVVDRAIKFATVLNAKGAYR